jgi:predicted kinase
MQNKQQATLYIFSGLPATGKSTLARNLAKTLEAQWLRIDTIEQSLKNQNYLDIYDAGYQIAFLLANDNLKLGLNVIADSSTPVEESRLAWREVAQKANCSYQEIEIICSDK